MSSFSLPDDVTAAHVRLSDALKKPMQDMDRLIFYKVLSDCYKRVQSFRIHCLFTVQYHTEDYITFTDVI